MGINDCIAKVQEKSNNSLSKQEAKDMLVAAVKAFDAGNSEAKILDDVEQILTKRKEKIKKLRKINVLSDFIKRRDYVDNIMKHIEEREPVKFLGMSFYNPLEEGFLNLTRSHQQHMFSVLNFHKQHLEARLSKAELLDFVQAPENQANIVREMAHLNVLGNEKPKTSITGDDSAFKAAKEIVDSSQTRLLEKRQAGSTVGFLNGRVTANMWSARKIAALTEDEFYDLVKDIEWSGSIATRDQWMDFRDRILAMDHVDIEDELHFGNVNSERSGILYQAGSLAELSGLSREITPTTDQYIKISDTLFEGNNIFERVGMEIEKDSRLIADLEFWGSDPSGQYDKVLAQLKAKTRGDEKYIRKSGGHILDHDFFAKDLKANVFRQVSKPVDAQVADIANVTRNLGAVSKLAGSLLTSFFDIATTAGQALEYRNGKGFIFSEMVDTVGRITDSIGDANKKVLQDELGAYAVMLDTVFDDLLTNYRYFDPEQAAVTSKTINKINRGILHTFRFNGMEIFTKGSVRGSHLGMMNILHTNKGLSYSEISKSNFRLKDFLDNNFISEKEWDFIRNNGEQLHHKGYGLISPEALNKLSNEKWAELFPEFKSSGSIKQAKRRFLSKYNAALLRESKTMTLMPDIVDNARLVGDSRPGTLVGEARRFITQFKSYAFGYAARVLTPMVRRGNVNTMVQYMSGAFALGLLINTMKDLAKGKTPRNYVDHPEMMVPIVGQILGFPFLDEIAMRAIQDDIPSSSLADIFVGPIPTDFLETVDRGIGLGQKFAKGELSFDDIGKAGVRTFGPTPFLRNYPGLSGVYNNLIYNNLMESFDPGYKRKVLKYMKERGQQPINFEELVGQ